MISFTRTPASAAPSLFEPIATVYRPQRVNVSTTWSTATIARAQISSDHVPPPNIFANVLMWLTCSGSVTVWPLTTCVTCTVDVCSWAPGVATGVPLEMISDRPSNVNSIPSVVTNELMPTTATKKPLMAPTPMQTSRATITDGTRPRPTELSSL